MNYSTAVFLINKNARAVIGVYETDNNAKRTTFKTLDQHIAIGDFAIVPTETRHKMTIIKIVDVDVDVDFDSPHPMEWIIGIVDRTAFEATLAQENTAIAVIKSAELRKKRDELRDAMFKDHLDTLKTLELSAINGTAETPKE